MCSREQVSNDGGLIGRVMSNLPPNLTSMGMGISGQWVCPGGWICSERVVISVPRGATRTM